MAQSTVEKVEMGSATPALKTLVRICAVMEMDLHLTFEALENSKPADYISMLAAEANAAKMTYGQYVAMRHEQQKNKDRP